MIPSEKVGLLSVSLRVSPSIEQGLSLSLVDDARLSPESMTLFNHKESIAFINVTGGESITRVRMELSPLIR